MRILPVVLLLLTIPVHAKKFALVVGGATNQNVGAGETVPRDVNPHEFGKSTARVSFGLQRQGYEVTTLFDTIGTPQNQMPEGLKKLQTESVDMPKLREMGAQSASKENVLNALRRIRDTGKSGDEFEFNLNAHGFRSCTGDLAGRKGVSIRPEDRQNQKEGCQHTINLSDPVTGRTVQVPTSEVADIIREIDAKGIKTNLNILSCHSGAAQELFEGLNNTCVVYGSSANNYAFQCMPLDKDWDVSYTGTAENIATSLWVNYADEMLRDPYFQNDPCLPRLRDHVQRNNIRGANRYELFMSARRHDLNGEEPSITSQEGLNYFRSGLFTAIGSTYAGNVQGELCAPDIDQRILELQETADGATLAALEGVVAPKRQRLSAAVARYNELLRQQVASGAAQEGGNIADGGVIDQSQNPDKPLQASGEALPDPAMDSLFANLKRPDSSTEVEVSAGTLQKGSSVESQSEAPRAARPKPAGPAISLPDAQRATYEASKEVMAIEREIVDDIDRAVVRPRIPASDPCRRS